MRNLKRALSLALASVMLFGMMVVGSSAAQGYPDVDEKDNIEAIEVLQAVNVMSGDERGFRPNDPVKRSEMARIMAELLNLDYDYYEAIPSQFTDVTGNYAWAKKYVDACAANGIIAGRGNGIYDPGSDVTAIEAASMMMRALGYFQNSGDYEGGFEAATVKQASQISLFIKINGNAHDAMTRNQIAQLALNTLESNMVCFDGTMGWEINGVKMGYVSKYTYRTSTDAKYNAIHGLGDAVRLDGTTELAQGQRYVNLGEQLYDGDLKLSDGHKDAFGRPSSYWEYKGEAIGTYMKKELIRQEYTTEVKGSDLYDLLGSEIIKEYSFDVTIDGVEIDDKTGSTKHNDVLQGKTGANQGSPAPYFDQTYMAKTYKDKVGQTGKGVLTQVFVNPETKHVDVAVINTYLAIATADYNEKKDEAKFEVYALTSTGSTGSKVYYKYAASNTSTDGTKNVEILSISTDGFEMAADVEKDDVYLVTQANGDIQTIATPQVITAATVDEFSKGSYVITDGDKYEYNTTVDYDPDTLYYWTGSGVGATQQLKDTEYNIYLDPYGYLIGVEVVEATKNYIFLTGIDQGSSNLKNKSANAAGILLDGTFVEFTMDMKNSENCWKHGEFDKTAAGTGFASASNTGTTVGNMQKGGFGGGRCGIPGAPTLWIRTASTP